MNDFLVGLLVCMFVCQSVVSPTRPLLRRFGQILRYADKRIVDIIKVYIERNNMQVKFIQFR